ncbi:MAG: ABC1 kinase family protein, partial [Chloroflexota bacterium]
MIRSALLDLRRLWIVLWVLAKFGLVLRIRDHFHVATGVAQGSSAAGVRMRRAFEELGLTYLKVGQYLAMRHDIVPGDISRELHKLFERITPASFDEVRAVIEAEFGRPLGDVFAEFDREPIAAASVAQVHGAMNAQGHRVAVKVQRPHIQEIFRSDIRNIRRLAALVDVTGVYGTLSMRDLVDEFATWTESELDFELEGAMADRLRENTLPFEHAPLIYWELTTPRVLTMELIEGLSLAEISRLFDAGGEAEVRSHLPNLNLRLALERLSVACLHQHFDVGLFHGDPHPGNVIIRDDNTIVFVDFGIFGELTLHERTFLRRHVEATATGNIAEGVRQYMMQLQPTAESDERAFRLEAGEVLGRWYQASRQIETSPVAERHLGRYAGEMLELVRRYHLRMGLSTLIFWRAMEALNSTALRFPEHFDLLESTRSYFEPAPEEIVERLIKIGVDARRALALASLLRDGAGQLSHILTTAIEDSREWAINRDQSVQDYGISDQRTRAAAMVLVGISLALV